MTTSTDKNTDTKKVKNKGPIRVEALGTIFILIALAYGYGFFFLDSHLAGAGEWTATKIHGAEVNIRKIKTSFFDGSFKLQGLQITNKEKPTENILQLGEVRFDFVWDALLRAKFVIEDASIENIQINVPRKKPGRILPKKEVAHQKITDSKLVKEFEQAVIAEGLKKYSGNALGDMASILGGKDPSSQLDEMKSTLQSEVKIKSMLKEIEGKEKEWTDKIAALTNKKELDVLNKRAHEYKFNNRDPIRSIKELSDILKQAKNKVSEFNKVSKEIKTDVNRYTKFISNIDNMVDEDIKTMTKRLKIPDVDVADMSKDIFAGMFLNKLGEYKKYADMAREYAPPKKTKADKEAAQRSKLKTPARGKGKNYHFAKKIGYPLFWLKKSTISSKPSTSQYSGDISGEITNVTNEPVLLGKPAKLVFKGNFPHQKVEGVQGTIIVDRTTAKALDKVDLTVAKFNVSGIQFSNSESLKIGLDKAKGSSQFKMVISDKNVTIALLNKFIDPQYNIEAKSKQTKDILSKVVNGINPITLNASAKGTWSNLDWDIDSNFGKEIGRGIKREVNTKIAAAKRKVEDHVKSQIKVQQDKLLAKYSSAKNKIDKLLGKQKTQMNKVKTEVESQVNSKKTSQKKTVKKKVKKALDKLKRKFKIKF